MRSLVHMCWVTARSAVATVGHADELEVLVAYIIYLHEQCWLHGQNSVNTKLYGIIWKKKKKDKLSLPLLLYFLKTGENISTSVSAGLLCLECF